MIMNTTGGFSPNWFTYKPIDPDSKAQGMYAMLKPEHKEDVYSMIVSQKEQYLEGTRGLQYEVKANGSVKLNDEQKAVLSEKYDPSNMSREDYVNFVDDLYEYGILQGDDRDSVQARGDGLILVSLGATYETLENSV